MLWEITITPKKSFTDTHAEEAAADIAALGLATPSSVSTARGFLVEGNLTAKNIDQIAAGLLVDAVVEDAQIVNLTESTVPTDNRKVLYVLPKPGVMDPVAQSALKAINDDYRIPTKNVRTFKKYWFAGIDDEQLKTIAWKILANDSVEQAIFGELPFKSLEVGSPYQFKLKYVPIRAMSDGELAVLSKKGQLFLSLTEMKTIKDFYEKEGKDPTDLELETIAQTWSEHCSHKTLAGRIHYKDEQVDKRKRFSIQRLKFGSGWGRTIGASAFSRITRAW